MNTRIKIGFMGGGMMAQVGHLPFYFADPRCDVLRICESRPSLVEALGQKFGHERIVQSYQTMLASNDIDAVVISVPRAATGPLTLAALKAGKHVMAEKPMGHSLEQAEQLVRAAASDLIYAIGFMKRYDPGIQAAKALFDQVAAEGRLGRLLLARFYDFSNAYEVTPPAHTRPKESRTERFPVWPLHPNWLPEKFRAAYGWFLNVASHDVNLLRLFFPGQVSVKSAYCAGDASIIATLASGDAAIVLEIAKITAGCWLEGAEFLFERGRIKVVIPSPMAIDAVSEVTLDDERGGLVGEKIATGSGWSFARQATGFIDALIGKSVPLTNGKDALGDMALTEDIWRRMAA
jgi:predicted dehydrogenase